MRTNSEKFLVEKFKTTPTKKKYDERYYIIEELQTPIGIPDFILFLKEHLEVLYSFFKNVPPQKITNGYAKIIATLHYEFPHTVEYIIKNTGMAPKIVRKILSDLRKYQIVENKSHSSFCLSENFNLPNIPIWSIEFKTKNWQRALKQAIRNRAFCKFSMIMMPYEMKELLLRKKNLFKQFKIGVVVFNIESNKTEILLKPRKGGPISKYLYIDLLGRIGQKIVED